MVRELLESSSEWLGEKPRKEIPGSFEEADIRRGVGSVECPRGTLYHDFSVDKTGMVVAANMITPSAQNTARIELDIREVVSSVLKRGGWKKRSKKISIPISKPLSEPTIPVIPVPPIQSRSITDRILENNINAKANPSLPFDG